MLSRDNQTFLFSAARKSIEYGFRSRKALLPDIRELTAELTATRASFVTLKIGQQLRGCIGTTHAVEPLAINIANNAYNAAFRDPRFEPLNKTDYARISLSLSILTEPLVIDFSSEQDLLVQLQPGVDGLIIESETYKATFLPVVWKSLSTPAGFLASLKQKAGMPCGMQVEKAWRYQAESYEEAN